ncbi:uncharacterized protein BO95DRAFT_432218 [Aspergillus brunneoviolaceus CBS 621.78]|uniref:Uncharacterized protein n=1 Tax=Aspergillus brunneoviolaceus CBS 621.78 TaxID=1450534 RepID=A0ACD1G7L1_9EURO|nr:hypothetical protein BO95DRAFT_432218 [Aspergillus brunneoviolaceus CBS 621.78]RAH45246.1 hypothetical protein BO95DRAFT_432218 [Aspergillus brunneoviolaceus CBS 621.78]
MHTLLCTFLCLRVCLTAQQLEALFWQPPRVRKKYKKYFTHQDFVRAKFYNRALRTYCGELVYDSEHPRSLIGTNWKKIQLNQKFPEVYKRRGGIRGRAPIVFEGLRTKKSQFRKATATNKLRFLKKTSRTKMVASAIAGQVLAEDEEFLIDPNTVDPALFTNEQILIQNAVHVKERTKLRVDLRESEKVNRELQAPGPHYPSQPYFSYYMHYTGHRAMPERGMNEYVKYQSGAKVE